LEKRLADIALNEAEPLLGMIGLMQEYNPATFTQVAEKIRIAFSSWSFPKVEQFLQLPTCMGSDFLAFNPASYRIPDELFNDITKQYQYNQAALGPIGVGNESKRNYFIQPLLAIALYPFRNSMVIKTESSLTSSIAHGQVEFVLTVLKSAIIFVVEAKQQNSQQGMAQLLMELYAAFHTNLGRGIKNVPIRGAVCTADQWVFIEFKRPYNKIAKSKVYFINGVNDHASVREILSICFSLFLEGFVGAIKSLFAQVGAILADLPVPSPSSSTPDTFFNDVSRLHGVMNKQQVQLDGVVLQIQSAANDAQAVAASNSIAAEAASWRLLYDEWEALKQQADSEEL